MLDEGGDSLSGMLQVDACCDVFNTEEKFVADTGNSVFLSHPVWLSSIELSPDMTDSIAHHIASKTNLKLLPTT